MTSVVRSSVRRRSRRRGPPAGTTRVVMSVPLISVVSTVPLVVVSWRTFISVGLPVPVLAVSLISISVLPVPVLVIPVTIPIARITVIVIIPIITVSRWTVVVTIMASFIVRWRSTIIMFIPVVIMTVVMPVSPASISTSSTTTSVTETEPGTRGLAVMKIYSRCRLMGSLGDGEINTDFKPRDFSPIQGFPGLLSIIGSFEVNEGKSSRPLSWTIQYHLDSINLAIATKLSF